MTRRLERGAEFKDWGTYVGRRLLQGLLVLWAAFTLAFIILYILPSDPVRIMLSGSGAEFANASDADLAKVRAEYGLDKSAPLQYLHALWNAASGDLGRSIQRGMPVTDLLGGALGQTVRLGLAAFAIALVLGVAVALGAAFTRNRLVRQLVLTTPSLGVSIPTFWSGLLFTQVFAFRLGWVNVFDQESWKSILLPALTLAIPTSAFIAQILAKSLSATLGEPYIQVVRSRGASEARVLLRNAFRNASLPLLTMIGMIVGNMLAGSVVVETVFSRMGVGRLTFEAVNAQDIPVVMGVVILAAAVFVVISLVVDLIYPLLDPRVSVRTARRRNAAPSPLTPPSPDGTAADLPSPTTATIQGAVA